MSTAAPDRSLLQLLPGPAPLDVDRRQAEIASLSWRCRRHESTLGALADALRALRVGNRALRVGNRALRVGNRALREENRGLRAELERLREERKLPR